MHRAVVYLAPTAALSDERVVLVIHTQLRSGSTIRNTDTKLRSGSTMKHGAQRRDESCEMNRVVKAVIAVPMEIKEVLVWWSGHCILQTR